MIQPWLALGGPVEGTIVAGKFRIERPLGQGGMGSVFVAVQEPLGRRVALKVIRDSRGIPAIRERFAREAQIVAQLRCPHVVTLFDFGEHEGNPYIAMELLEGDTLRARLHTGPLSLDEALSLARDLACGLRAAHELGIAHRDLKPENVVLVPDKDRTFVAKLLDFGIARLRERGDGARTEPQAALTEVGVVVGTPGYLAPEAAVQGSSDDPRADLYSLGIVLFEALTGEPPFMAPNPGALLLAHLTQAAPDVRTRKADVPEPVAALIGRLLEKDPARRGSAESLVGELDRLRAASHATESFPALIDVATQSAIAPLQRPSIAVQPFSAIGGNDEDVLLAEGISEDILNALTCFKQLFVIAQTTMWEPGGRDTDALRVGRTLGVRFVVQGMVRRIGSALRITAKLVDASTGAQVWAQRYDRPASDVFAVQDELTSAIVAHVAGKVEAELADRARRQVPQNLAAWDLVAQGRAFHHRRTAEDNARARAALDRAVELDPEYAQAHAWRACAYAQSVALGGDVSAGPTAWAAVDRALALDDNDSECHRLRAEVAFLHSDLDKASHHHARAIALNPNDARVVGQAGELAVYRGELDDAVHHLERAARLDPLGPNPYLRHLARARYLLGELDEAQRLLRAIDDKRPDQIGLAAAVAASRCDDVEMKVRLAQLRAIAPDWSATWWLPPWGSEALKQRWLDGFRLAGLA